MERIIAGTDGRRGEVLRSKLGDWDENRAWARHEAAIALNKTMVAGFKRAGYSLVWKAPPGSCKICAGCACTVDKGVKA